MSLYTLRAESTAHQSDILTLEIPPPQADRAIVVTPPFGFDDSLSRVIAQDLQRSTLSRVGTPTSGMQPLTHIFHNTRARSRTAVVSGVSQQCKRPLRTLPTRTTIYVLETSRSRTKRTSPRSASAPSAGATNYPASSRGRRPSLAWAGTSSTPCSTATTTATTIPTTAG